MNKSMLLVAACATCFGDVRAADLMTLRLDKLANRFVSEMLKYDPTIAYTQLPAASRATYAVLKERLESELEMRVCKTELWYVNHFFGWQNDFADVADRQPVGTSPGSSLLSGLLACLHDAKSHCAGGLRSGPQHRRG